MTDQPANIDPEPVAITSDLHPDDAAAARSASRFVWVIGLLELILASAFTAFCISASRSKLGVYQQYFEGRISIDDWLDIAPYFKAMAFGGVVFGVLPGLTYIALGFPIRRGSFVAGLVVAILATGQIIVLAIILCMQLFQAFVVEEPQLMTISVLTIGTPIVVLMYTARCAWSVWRLRVKYPR